MLTSIAIILLLGLLVGWLFAKIKQPFYCLLLSQLKYLLNCYSRNHKIMSPLSQITS